MAYKDKTFDATLQVRLDREDREKIDKIVRHKIGVTRNSRAGAMRQILRQWESNYRENHELKESNIDLKKELNRLMELIAAQANATQIVNEQAAGKPYYQRKSEETKVNWGVAEGEEDLEPDID